MKYFLYVDDRVPRINTWSQSIAHARPFSTQAYAEAAIRSNRVADATGTEQIDGSWYVFKDSEK
jgi:hypothetical protein